MLLDINIIKKPQYVYLVVLKGSIDTESHTQLEDEAKELIDEKTKAVILDMSGVNYVSSAGIKAILWVKKALKEKDAAFSMVNLQPQITKVFDAMKILPMIDIFEDMPEADKYIDQIIKEELEKESV